MAGVGLVVGEVMTTRAKAGSSPGAGPWPGQETKAGWVQGSGYAGLWLGPGEAGSTGGRMTREKARRAPGQGKARRQCPPRSTTRKSSVQIRDGLRRRIRFESRANCRSRRRCTEGPNLGGTLGRRRSRRGRRLPRQLLPLHDEESLALEQLMDATSATVGRSLARELTLQHGLKHHLLPIQGRQPGSGAGADEVLDLGGLFHALDFEAGFGLLGFGAEPSAVFLRDERHGWRMGRGRGKGKGKRNPLTVGVWRE